jgi:hypothetical protein
MLVLRQVGLCDRFEGFVEVAGRVVGRRRCSCGGRLVGQRQGRHAAAGAGRGLTARDDPDK